MLAPQKLLLLNYYCGNSSMNMIWKKVCFKSSQGIAFPTQKPRESFMFSRNKLLDISEVTVKIEVQSLELIFSVLQLVWGLVWFIATMLFQAL